MRHSTNLTIGLRRVLCTVLHPPEADRAHLDLPAQVCELLRLTLACHRLCNVCCRPSRAQALPLLEELLSIRVVLDGLREE